MTIVNPQVVIQPRMPSAASVIQRMERLLEARHHLRVTRAAFMRQWKALRRLLNMTPEYKQLKERVAMRADYSCEDCGRSTFCDMHHDEAVAWNPRRALDESNVRYVCRPCHNAHHRQTPRTKAASGTIRKPAVRATATKSATTRAVPIQRLRT